MAADPRFRRWLGAYRHAARSPGHVASLIVAWQRAFGDEPPAVALGCPEDVILELGLCLRPRDERWLDDVSEIAQALRIDPDRLAAFLRRCAVVERLAAAPPLDEHVDGRLLAARDRGEDDEC